MAAPDTQSPEASCLKMRGMTKPCYALEDLRGPMVHEPEEYPSLNGVQPEVLIDQGVVTPCSMECEEEDCA